LKLSKNNQGGTQHIMGGIKFIKALGKRTRANGPGLTVAVIALIFALAGGALAASGALTGKQKKEVTKIAKKYAGENGAPGANGKDGVNGKDGANGTSGAPGKDGESVNISAATLGECSAGGTKFTNATGTSKACNGKEGEPGEQGEAGPEGQPWTAGGTLPPGATETGSWAFNGTEEDKFGIWTPISFSIPLSAGLEPSHIHYLPQGTPGSGPCPGGVNAPKALPGELCIYAGEVFQASFRNAFKYQEESAEGASAGGALLIFDPTGETAVGAGSFAVTGCSTEVGSPAPCS
jgi:hypothetical protein